MFQTQTPAANLSAADQLNAIAYAFPQRRMAIQASGKQGVMVTLRLGIGCLLFLLGLLYMTAPNLIYDYKISRDPVVDTQAEVHGSCKTTRFIVVDCDVTINYRPTPQDTAAREVERGFWFISFTPPMSAGAVRSKADPSMITTTMAIEQIANRIFIMSGLTLVFGGLAIASCFAAWTTHSFNRLAGDKPILRPVLAKITYIQQKRLICFKTDVNGIEKKHSNIMRKTDAPLYLPRYEKTALAVTVEGSEHVILLDENLTVLDFTEQEKAALRAAIAA